MKSDIFINIKFGLFFAVFEFFFSNNKGWGEGFCEPFDGFDVNFDGASRKVWIFCGVVSFDDGADGFDDIFASECLGNIVALLIVLRIKYELENAATVADVNK